MKKTKLLLTVNSNSIKKALEKDLDLIWIHTNYESFNYHETLETLYHCGIESFPYLKKELELLKQQENNINKQNNINYLNKIKLWWRQIFKN